MSITRRLAGTWLAMAVVGAGLCALALPARFTHREPPHASAAFRAPAGHSVPPAHPSAPLRAGSQGRRESKAGLREHTDKRRTKSPEGASQFRRLQQQDERGEVPADGLIRAKRHRDQMPRIQALSPALSDLSMAGIDRANWTWLGPGNIGGRVRSIVVNPVVPSTWFTGSVSGGIWKTLDSGAHWEPVNDFLANLSISSMVIHPGDPAVMYAGTGEYAMSLQGAGIFKSTDGGDTWAQLGSTAGDEAFNHVNRLAMSPDGGVLLAATYKGIYRTTDGGATFTLVLNTWFNPDFDNPMYVAFNPNNSSKAIASGYDGKAWYSNDAGVTWTAATGLPALPGSARRAELAYAPSNPAIVYASVDTAGGTIYKSTNGGATYGLVSTGAGYFRNPPNNQGWYDNAIWVDPTNANTLVVGGVGLYKSTNGGVTLTDIIGIVHVDFHAIVSMPGYNGSTNRQVLVGNDGGVFFINDILAAPTGWVSKNNNLGITQFYGAAGNDASGTIVGGAQDNGTLQYTVAGGPQAHVSMAGGDGGYAASDPTDPNYFYGEFQWLSLHRSSDGGASSSMFFGSAIPDANGNSNFIAPFILDPSNPNTLLAGGRSLWRTANAKYGSPPAFSSIKAPAAGGIPISAIAVAPGNSGVCWVGHNNGDVYKAVDCTAVSPTWTQVDTNSPGLPNRMVMRLTIDPSDPSGNRVYAAFGGFSPANLWRTANGGASWTSASGAGDAALPSAPVHDVEISAGASSFLYAATEIGIFTSEDAGATWQVPQDGPANVIVSELFWMGSDLVAATFGRGLFTTSVVAGGAPSSFGKSFPAHGATGLAITQGLGLGWQASAGAAGYEYCHDRVDNNTCDTSWVDAGTTRAATLFGLTAGATYFWQVRARGAGTTEADIGAWWTLTTSGDVTPPAVTSVRPFGGETLISPATLVTATFSEPIDAVTLMTNTFVVRNPAGAAVGATLSYDAASRVGTLTPSAALAAATTYTATISTVVKDLAGNALVSPVVWSFTTTSPSVTAGLTTVGAFLDTGDSNYLNGSKVTTAAAGQVSSMSVYVGPIDSVVANRQYQLAIYRDSAGRPGTLVAASATGTLVANAWNALPVSASLLGNTSYWLMFNTNGRTASVNNMRYNTGAAGQGAYSISSVPFGTWPATFPPATTATLVFSLFAAFGTDSTAPTVSAVTPVNGATGISAAAAVTATFSEPIDAATLTAGTFVLRTPASVIVPATVSYNAGTRVGTLTPIAPLSASTTYTATLVGGGSGVKDVAGNPLSGSVGWSFTTVLADTTPPTVTGVTPAIGAAGVSTATALTATFNEAINPATLTTTTFALRNPANVAVPATVSYNAATRVGTLTPLTALATSTTYTATVAAGSAGVKDASGNSLASPFVWSFTTTGAAIPLGLTTVGSALDSGDSNYLNGSRVTTTGGGQISSMSVYVGAVDSTVANRQYQLAIYRDAAGRPGTLVAASAAGTLLPNAWNTLPITAALSPGTNYWLMFNTNGRTASVNNMRYNAGPAGQGAYSTASVPFGTWPSAFPAVTTTNFVFSLFATFGS